MPGPRVDLWRYFTGPTGTGGVLEVGGVRFCLTLEQPWNGNRPDNPRTRADESSCIPPGEYLYRVRPDDKWPEVIEIQGVRGRAGILIHPGNGLADTVGCILVGQRDGGIAALTQFPTLTRSRLTMARLIKALGGDGSTGLYITHTTAETKVRA
jgi:hypothetical protein